MYRMLETIRDRAYSLFPTVRRIRRLEASGLIDRSKRYCCKSTLWGRWYMKFKPNRRV